MMFKYLLLLVISAFVVDAQVFYDKRFPGIQFYDKRVPEGPIRTYGRYMLSKIFSPEIADMLTN